MENAKIKIFINEKPIETTRRYLFLRDFFELSGNTSLCPPVERYIITLETNDKYWEDKDITEECFEIKDGMKFKLFPKASTSTRD